MQKHNPEPPYFNRLIEADHYLDSLGLFKMELGLERMAACLRGLGLAKLPYLSVQVVGTNGKGSTASFLATLGAAHNLKVGLYTSPHFICPRERITLFDGTSPNMASEELWLRSANSVMSRQAESLSYFEFLTVMAAWIFKTAGVDLAVFEAGLGGRHDATTALKVDSVLFTAIDLDHENILGHSLKQIAGDKADAMRQGQQCLTFEQACAPLLRAVAAQKRASLAIIDPEKTLTALTSPDGRAPILSLAGRHQRLNAGLALAAYQQLAQGHDLPISVTACRKGLATTKLPGRMQFIYDNATCHYILDSAHNPAAMSILKEALRSRRIIPEHLIFTCLEDKDFENMRPTILELTPGAILVPELPHNPRRRASIELAAQLGPRAVPMPNLSQALEKAGEGLTLICGSMYLLAEFYKLFPDALKNSR